MTTYYLHKAHYFAGQESLEYTGIYYQLADETSYDILECVMMEGIFPELLDVTEPFDYIRIDRDTSFKEPGWSINEADSDLALYVLLQDIY